MQENGISETTRYQKYILIGLALGYRFFDDPKNNRMGFLFKEGRGIVNNIHNNAMFALVKGNFITQSNMGHFSIYKITTKGLSEIVERLNSVGAIVKPNSLDVPVYN